MNENKTNQMREQVNAVYRSESRRVFATLIRLLGDFDLAEALGTKPSPRLWSNGHVMEYPPTHEHGSSRWAVSERLTPSAVAAAFNDSLAEPAQKLDQGTAPLARADAVEVEDDQLRLIFTCAAIQLLIAEHANRADTTGNLRPQDRGNCQRASQRSRHHCSANCTRQGEDSRCANSHEAPSITDLPGRLDAVLSVIYLVFNEGYSASSGESLTRSELSGEAIQFRHLLIELPPDSEAMGLLALMLLQESRRTARIFQRAT